MFFDLHNDFPTATSEDGFDSFAELGGTVTAAIWTSGFCDYEASARADALIDKLSPRFPVAIEDLGFLARRGDESFDFCRLFYCSLTWNYDNAYAGGALGYGTLTARGRALINRLNGACALDLAHLNKNSFYPALELAARPMCSHTGFCGGPRCLDDGQIRALIARRGIIGLAAVTRFSGAKDIRGFAETCDGFLQRYGDNTLCLGTDLYGSDDIPKELSDYSMLDAIRAELEKLGSGAAADGLFYKNAQRFYEEIQNERHL